MEWTDKRFNDKKARILGKEDLSNIGGIDKEILDIVNCINDKKDLCTTSSCAGRITLLERKTDKKTDTKWLIASHQPVTFEQINEVINSEHEVWLMQESCILHVFAQTMEAADKFLEICRRVGFKRSGIMAFKNRIMIEMMGNEKVETLVVKDGKVLPDDEYLKLLIEACNHRMKRSRAKMDEFYKELKKY